MPFPFPPYTFGNVAAALLLAHGSIYGAILRPSILQSIVDYPVLVASPYFPLRYGQSLASNRQVVITAGIKRLLTRGSPPQVERPSVFYTLNALATGIITVIVYSVDAVARTWTQTKISKEGFKVSVVACADCNSSIMVRVMAFVVRQASRLHRDPSIIFRLPAHSVNSKSFSHGGATTLTTTRTSPAQSQLVFQNETFSSTFAQTIPSTTMTILASSGWSNIFNQKSQVAEYLSCLKKVFTIRCWHVLTSNKNVLAWLSEATRWAFFILPREVAR